MSPRKPSAQELTKEMIIKEARVQFEKKDFDKVSMRSIAKELGCSHGAIYYHFKNKAELFYAVVDQYFFLLNSLIDEIIESDKDNATKLRNLLLGYIEFGLNNQNQYEFMFMFRNNEVDSLSREAANLCFEKFAAAVLEVGNNTILLKEIYAAFISLHGFVSHYRGYVTCFEEAIEVAFSHVDFILKALK